MSNPEYLGLFEQHGVSATPQRLEVAAVLFERPQHLSAEQIIERLSVAGSKVSKATVYNSLKLFSECGLVKELTVDPERKYYDSTVHPHHHFYNADTGEIFDIPDERVKFARLPGLPEGTESDSIEVMIRIRSKSE